MKALHILLIIAVLGGRLVVVVHEANLKAHTPGHTCEFCLHVSHLGHATLGAPLHVFAVPPALPTFVAASQLSHQYTFISFLARGPPGHTPL